MPAGRKPNKNPAKGRGVNIDDLTWEKLAAIGHHLTKCGKWGLLDRFGNPNNSAIVATLIDMAAEKITEESKS